MTQVNVTQKWTPRIVRAVLLIAVAIDKTRAASAADPPGGPCSYGTDFQRLQASGQTGGTGLCRMDQNLFSLGLLVYSGTIALDFRGFEGQAAVQSL